MLYVITSNKNKEFFKCGKLWWCSYTIIVIQTLYIMNNISIAYKISHKVFLFKCYTVIL